MARRSNHYWLWFVLFGIVSSALTYNQHHALDGESYWLLISGMLGILAGARWLSEARYSRAYDLLIGLVFGSAGGLGILHGIGVNPLAQYGALAELPTLFGTLGLSQSVYPSIIHTVLGVTSLAHALRAE